MIEDIVKGIVLLLLGMWFAQVTIYLKRCWKTQEKILDHLDLMYLRHQRKKSRYNPNIPQPNYHPAQDMHKEDE